MALERKQFLINLHTSGSQINDIITDVKLGEIVVKHNNETPELYIKKDNGSAATFIDKVAIEGLISNLSTTLSGEIDALSGSVEAHIEAVDTKFEGYYTSAQTDTAIEKAKNAAIGAANAYTDTKVEAAESALTTMINGVDGKVDELATSAMTEIDRRAIKTEVDTLVANTSAATYDKAYGDASAYTDTKIEAAKKALDETINGVESKVDTLIGEDSGKTVRNIAIEEVTKVVSGAPEAFDTLKEIADWIGTASGSGAATLVADIEALKEADKNLTKSINDVDAKADTVSGLVVSHIEAVNTKFEGYYTSAQTDEAIATAKGQAVSAASAYTFDQVEAAKSALTTKIDGVSSRVEALEELSGKTESAIQTIEVSGITGVEVVADGTKRTIDFTHMEIDCGTF